MNKFTTGILGIIGILVLVVFASGCTSSSNSATNTPSNTKTYSSENITFNYPDSWALNPDYPSPSLGTGNAPGNIKYNVGVETFSIKEYAKESAEESTKIPATMEAVAQSIISAGTTSTMSKKEITVDGVKGIEYTATTGTPGVEVFFAKGDKLYEVMMTSSNLDADMPGFNMIINSITTK